jgi:hypothetical protein
MGHANSQVTQEILLKSNYAIVHVSPDKKKDLPHMDIGAGYPIAYCGDEKPYVIISDLRTALNTLSKSTVVWDPDSKAECQGYGPILVPHGRSDFGLLFVIVLLVQGYDWQQYGFSWIVPLIANWPQDENRVDLEFLAMSMQCSQNLTVKRKGLS